MQAESEMQVDFLYRALAEAHDTIKFTDTKAEIIIILAGGILAFLGAIHASIDTALLQVLTTIGLANLLIAVTCAVWALHPRVNPENFIDLGGATVTTLYHVRRLPGASGWRNLFGSRSRNWLEISLPEYLRQLEALDRESLKRMLVYEFLKVSFIREEKVLQAAWSIRFMQVAGTFLALLVIALYLSS